MMNYGDDRTGTAHSGDARALVLDGAVLMLGLIAAPAVVSAGGCAGRRPGADAGRRISTCRRSRTIAPAKTRFLSLGVGKSVVIDLPRDVKDVLVADPKIANAVIRSSQRAYIIGGQVGQTNVVFFAADGQQVASYDIAVKRDLNGMRTALRQSLPGVQIEGVGDSVMLTGSVSSPIEAQQAGDVAAKLVGGADKVVNNIVVRGRDQVMLKVVVGEVRRDIVKQMGVDLSASLNCRHRGRELQQFEPVLGLWRTDRRQQRASAWPASPRASPTVSATMRAMESAGVMRTLAEPSLTAISGESATFIAGGEFPIPAGYSCDPVTHVCTTQITYKKFGISLNFTPVVLSEGRISLRVMTEVSELSNHNAITLTQAVSSTSTTRSPSPRSRPAAPKPRWKFPPAARWRWPA